jgi:glycerol kinase
MLDTVVSERSPLAQSTRRGEGGCFGIVAWAEQGKRVFGAESIMLAAGSNIDWLRDDLNLISSSAESHDIASMCQSTEGVLFVPAPLGLGTPHWDYGARSTFVGLTRGTTRSHMVRAVLEGVAHRGADLVEAVGSDAVANIEVVRVDGGMSRNPTFVQALANFTGINVEVSPHTEGTTVGAGRLALVGLNQIAQVSETAELWDPQIVVFPDNSFDRIGARLRWEKATSRSLGWIPELSSLDF